MGSGASSHSDTPGVDLRLPESGLKFSYNQLRTLNCYVDALHEEDQKGRISAKLESAVESLVQRIVDGAGQRDPRFRCCHIIALHREKKMRSRSLEYLVTLDSLPLLNASEECRLQDGPVGYGKIRLTGREADKWEEFLTPAGYLCRDKVVERWVELVARCAQARGGGGSRVVGARAHQRAEPYHYYYLEKASSPQTFQDRRLAIVEGAAWVMVRVGAGEAEAKLMLGARVDGCSASAYTSKVSLTHPLALLHYTSAQKGYYAVAVGPPSAIIAGDRTSTWQLWHPSLEAHLDSHTSDVSTVARIAGALNALIDRMREGAYQGTLRVVSRYLASCVLRRRLDRCATYSTPAARCCVSSHASHHLLLVLDSLLHICEHGGTAGYVYPVEKSSLVRRGSRDSDWATDAACVRNCLLHLHQAAGEDISPSPSECLEMALFSKWENLNREMKSTLAGPKYSRRQLRYLWRVASELVNCKNLVVMDTHSNFRANLLQVTSQHQESVEDLVHIMAIMLDQARDLYLNNFKATLGEFDKEMSAYRSKKWNKLKDYYDASSTCLIDAVRRDPALRQTDLSDQLDIMTHILHWLHKGAKEDKKYLGPVLKPYLEGLFTMSLENAWFLDDFDAKKCEEEYDGLKDYCIGVHDGSIEPCMGLLDAAKKLALAKATVDFIDRFKHIDFRIVFPTGDGMAISFPAKLPSRREHSSARILTLSRRDKNEAKLRLARRCVLGAFTSALVGERCIKAKKISRLSTTDEVLNSAKNGDYCRTSKPDIIPSTSSQDIRDLGSLDNLPRVVRRKSTRRIKSASTYGFPEISITSQSDAKTMRRKYHTLRSLVYTEPVESIKEMRRRPRSAGSTMRNKEAMSRPSILETLDFITGVKDVLSVEESGASDTEEGPWSIEDEWLVGQTAPLNLLAARSGNQGQHLALGELVPALLMSGKFTVLQELCTYLDEDSEGALFALHRLARAARSRSSERASSAWRLPELVGPSPCGAQSYRARAPDDDVTTEPAPQPPPLPRHHTTDNLAKRYSTNLTDYIPPKKLEDLEQHLDYLEHLNSRLNIKQHLNNNYTGIINPIYDIKMPKDKFVVKRSSSLGKAFDVKNLSLDKSKYNLTVGHKSGKKTNDVLTAVNGTGETEIEKKYFSQRRNVASVVGDSYKPSRATIE